MNYRSLGPIKRASCLALGGGGIGQVLGAADRDEALATVEAAAAGINFFDVVETNFLWRLYYFLERSLAYISKKSSIGLDNRPLTAVEPTW